MIGLLLLEKEILIGVLEIGVDLKGIEDLDKGGTNATAVLHVVVVAEMTYHQRKVSGLFKYYFYLVFW